MVMAIEFAVRGFAGGTQHGSVAGDTQGNFIQVGSGDAVSLNLSRESVVAYEQSGNDLIVRVAGYSDYFCDLSEALQDEIIHRTEHTQF